MRNKESHRNIISVIAAFCAANVPHDNELALIVKKYADSRKYFSNTGLLSVIYCLAFSKYLTPNLASLVLNKKYLKNITSEMSKGYFILFKYY